LIRPKESERFDYEEKMAVIIGQGRPPHFARDGVAHVAGYACYNDGSIRDWQRHTSQIRARQEFCRHRRDSGRGWSRRTKSLTQQADDCDPPQRRRSNRAAPISDSYSMSLP